MPGMLGHPGGRVVDVRRARRRMSRAAPRASPDGPPGSDPIGPSLSAPSANGLEPVGAPARPRRRADRTRLRADRRRGEPLGRTGRPDEWSRGPEGETEPAIRSWGRIPT